MEVDKAMTLICFKVDTVQPSALLAYDTVDIMNIPIKGIKSKDEISI